MFKNGFSVRRCLSGGPVYRTVYRVEEQWLDSPTAEEPRLSRVRQGDVSLRLRCLALAWGAMCLVCGILFSVLRQRKKL
mgnify:CR=1 FL=1